MSSEFRPLPFLGNAHVQTLLGNLFKEPEIGQPTRECPLHLPDGDQLLLYDTTPPTWKPGDRIALLVHGLGGTHRSAYLVRVAKLLLRHGLRVVRLDLRGCGGGMALARRPYHGGCSEDVRAAALEIGRWTPESPLVVIGFSLGGNIALKLAGETRDHPVANLELVAAVSPPVDFQQCAALMALPRNRLYELHYVRTLIRQVRQRQAIFPEEAAVSFPRRMTMRLFDDLYTAPRCGFDDALHYYRCASSRPVLPRIAVPALILTARDDPFITVEPLETLAPHPHLEVSILEWGGHLGFLGWHKAGGIRWAEHRVVEWVVKNGDAR
jgi:predicted alpha/beta-fold hydrolase